MFTKIKLPGKACITCFRDFSAAQWEIFAGNLLMLATIAFYITWWAASSGDVNNTGTGFFLTATLFAGVAAIAVLSIGIKSLPRAENGIPVMYIMSGAVTFFIILLLVTKIAFQRAVTSELLLITMWSALEWSAIAALHGNGRFHGSQALTLAIMVALAAGVGIICYILHYRLDETARFWNGLFPLIVDEGVVAVFLAMMAHCKRNL